MNKNTAPRAEYAAKPISQLMLDYVAWLKAETGYDVDPMSVQLSGVLRGTFQQSPSNQARIAEVAARKVVEAKARADRKAASEKKAAEPKVEKVVPVKKALAKPLAKVAS